MNFIMFETEELDGIIDRFLNVSVMHDNEHLKMLRGTITPFLKD